MFDCWAEIEKLQGRTLYTLDQRNAFDMVEVGDTYVIVQPHAQNIKRRIVRNKIEGACRELMSIGYITRSRIQEKYTEFQPAYVAAMLAELPEVSYIVRPITLYYKMTPQAKPGVSGIQQPPPKQPPAPPVEIPESPSGGLFRNRAAFGKRQEFIAIAELLRRGHDVYMTLVDDQGIDCVVRIEKEKDLQYWDIQIKARSKKIVPQRAALFAAMDIPKPRENYIFIFYSEQVDMYWIIPSMDLVRLAYKNVGGVNAGKYSINFCKMAGGKAVPDPRYVEYEKAFHRLDS